MASVASAFELPARALRVWWAQPRIDHPWLDHLDSVERERFHEYQRADDQARFLTGALLVRHVYAADLGIDPAAVRLDRRCTSCGRPHGKVRPAAGAQTAVAVSVSHSGRWVAVAAYRGAAVGVDVERVDPNRRYETLERVALTERERQVLRVLPEAARRSAFIAYWARKEAVLKAVGEGLRTSPRSVEVSPPGTPPRVVSWHDRRDLPRRLWLHDLNGDAGHRAAVAVLDHVPRRVSCVDATPLLSPATAVPPRAGGRRDGKPGSSGIVQLTLQPVGQVQPLQGAPARDLRDEVRAVDRHDAGELLPPLRTGGLGEQPSEE